VNQVPAITERKVIALRPNDAGPPSSTTLTESPDDESANG
jgi:hypothetical protein